MRAVKNHFQFVLASLMLCISGCDRSSAAGMSLQVRSGWIVAFYSPCLSPDSTNIHKGVTKYPSDLRCLSIGAQPSAARNASHSALFETFLQGRRHVTICCAHALYFNQMVLRVSIATP